MADLEKVSGLEDESLPQPDEDYTAPTEVLDESHETEEKSVTPEEAEEFRTMIQDCKFLEELADTVETFADKHEDMNLKIWAHKIRKPGELPDSIRSDYGKVDYGIMNKLIELVDMVDPHNPEDITMHLSPDKETELREVIQGCGAENMATEVRKLGEKWGNQKLLKQADYIEADDEMHVSHQYSIYQYYAYLTGKDN